MSFEANILERFKALAALPAECQIERQLIQGKLCLLVNCSSSATADILWRNQYQLAAPLTDLGLAERCIILYRGRVWHPAFRNQE